MVSIYRQPQLGQERRGAQEDWHRPRRGKRSLSVAFDDRIRHPQRSWKKYRKTQYETAVEATK